MKSINLKRSIVIHGHKTSISLEDAFWVGLKDIAKGQRIPLSEMIGGIDKRRVAGRAGISATLVVAGETKASGAGGRYPSEE